jgi:transposase InsO family protein
MLLSMSWLTTDAMEQKIAFITEAEKTPKGGFAALCRKFGISRKTGYKWRGRFREKGGVIALRERSRRPHRSRQTGRDLVERILALRQPDGWGARKIAHLLWEQGEKVSVATVHRTLLRQNKVHRLDRHTVVPGRFERPVPNDLFQIDFKGAMGRGEAKDEPLSVLDDHSRYAAGLFAMRDHTWERVRDCLIAVFAGCGKPLQMLMDHGTPWWNNNNGWGLSRLAVFLIAQDIELIFGRVAHPQTQGKVERFHRTLGRSMIRQGLPERWEQWQSRYDGFVERYNEVRPHEALGMKRPAERYVKSPRVYQSRAEPWVYPAGLAMLSVDAHGSIRWEKRRCFVCEALVHHAVAAELVGGQLLIRFRNMYVREIDLATGQSWPLIHPVSDLVK